MTIAELTEIKEKALMILEEARRSGQLLQTEEIHRRALVENAEDFDTIDRQISDLLDPPGEENSSPVRTSPRASGTLVLPPRAATVFCLMAERNLRTHSLGDHTSSLTVMGSTVMDLSDAKILNPAVFDIVTVMGETRILLPRGTPVENKVLPVMGAVTEDKNLVISHSGSRVILQGVVVMGEVKIMYV